MKTWVLIPAYQPDAKLCALVEALVSDFPVLVVDDGSDKACAEFFSRAKDAGAVVLSHAVNRGKGAALKTGIAYIAELGDETPGAVTADADGQHTPADIAKIAAAMEEKPGALILGARDFSKMPLRSRTGNSITHFAFRASTGIDVRDTQTGLRGLPKSLFSKLLELAGERYEYEMNMLLSLPVWNASFFEVPIDTIYIDGNKSTHFHALRDGLRVFSRVIKYAASSLVSTAVDYALYFLLLWMGLSAAQSFAIARALSSLLNYGINCRAVFHTRPSAANALGYAALVGLSLLAGSAVVSLLSRAGLNDFLAKLAVDAALFLFNYFMQKHVVFKKRRGKEEAQ